MADVHHGDIWSDGSIRLYWDEPTNRWVPIPVDEPDGRPTRCYVCGKLDPFNDLVHERCR